VNKSIKGSLSILTGAFLISFSPVFVKLVDLQPTVSGFYRMFFGCISLLVIFLIKNNENPFKRKISKFIIIGAVFISLDLWFWHRSIVYIGPGLSTLLANFQILILPFLALLMFNQKTQKIQIFSIFLGLLGLYFIAGENWGIAGYNYKLGILFGLLAAVTYAGYIISMKQIDHNVKVNSDPIFNLMFVSLISAALLLLFLFAEQESISIKSFNNLIWMIFYGLLSHVLGWFFILNGLQKITAVSAGIILLAQPIFSYVWEIMIFQKVILPIEYLGIVSVLLAMIITITSENQKN
jgi:drug/metabolite transporter (DMT)-like permease|tara:strand:- start:1506 stop:2390 length:885 start_codon:yes stop_codon:yes gene_type:complete